MTRKRVCRRHSPNWALNDALPHGKLWGWFDHVATWKRMEALPRTQKTRFIGISDHNTTQIDEIMRSATTKTKVMQIELHPCLPQTEYIEKLHGLGITVNAYAPLANINIHYTTKTTKILEHHAIRDVAAAKAAHRPKWCSLGT